MRWINRTQSSFSESFFPVFNGRYFLFHHSPLWASKYHLASSTRTALANGFLRGKLYLGGCINRTHGSSSESFFPVFNGRYFPFHRSPLWVCKYQFANFTTIVLVGHLEGKTETLWDELTEHKAVSQKILFDFILGYFHFHHSPLWASKYHFANSTRTVLAKGFLRGNL